MPNFEKIALYQKMPQEYQETLKQVLTFVKSFYQDNLVDVMLAGSGGKGYLISNWSDLDMYIITSKYDPMQNIKFLKLLSDSSFKVHVGTTFYDLKSFLNLQVDTKTYITLYERQYLLDEIHPFLLESKLIEIPEISYEDIQKHACKDIFNTMQLVQREAYKYQDKKDNLQVLVKKLTVLCKEYLNIKNIFTYHYKMVFDNINIQMNLDFDIIKIIESKDKDETLFKNVLTILEKINMEMGEKNYAR